MAQKRPRRVSESDVRALSKIQDQVYKLAQRAEKICARIERVDEVKAEYAREQFVRPMEAAAVGGDDAIKSAQEALELVDIVTKIGDLGRR